MASNAALQPAPEKRVRTCSIWRALEVVGDVPILLILEAVWLGESRFGDIRERTCLSRPLVADRLKKLVADGLLERQLYCERPPRYEYRQTAKGRDLFPVTMMLLRWERIWSAKEKDFRIALIHKECGKSVMPEPVCGHCRLILQPQDIDWREGSGLETMEVDYTRRRQHRKRHAIAANLSLFTDSAELLGDRWAGLVMRAIFTDLNRFDQILADSGMASNILADRLAWLVESGFLEMRRYRQGPDRFAYYPSRKSLDYLPVLLMLQRWGDHHYPNETGPPVELIHNSCGMNLAIETGCGACKGELTLENVRIAETPA